MNVIQRCKPYLGTYVEIQLKADADEGVLLGLSSSAFAEISRVEKLMSFHNPESELSLINRLAFQQPVAISEDTQHVLAQALALSEQSNGVFDVSIAPQLIQQGLLPDFATPTDDNGSWLDITLTDTSVSFKRPLQLDLGGIAKGYAVDQAINIIPEGVEAIINAGGDLRMTHWQGKKAALRIPSHPHQVIEVAMQAPALATSGCYYTDNGSAMISPATRQAIKSSRSYSVFAPNCMHADALTKVVFLTPDNLSLLDSYGASAIVVDEAASLHRLT